LPSGVCNRQKAYNTSLLQGGQNKNLNFFEKVLTMRNYESHPHVPEWIAAMNGELLSPAELDVLNFVFWCKKYGCRTSNNRLGKFSHHSHCTVQRAVMKLYKLDLIAIDNFGKRTRTLKAVNYPDRETWEELTRIRGIADPDVAQNAPHISTLDKTTSQRESSSVECSESLGTSDENLPRGGDPPNPPGGSRRDAGFSALQAAAKYGRRLIKDGCSREKAIARVLKQYPDIEHSDGCFRRKK